MLLHPTTSLLESQQRMSPIGFLCLKLPPPPHGAVLLVYNDIIRHHVQFYIILFPCFEQLTQLNTFAPANLFRLLIVPFLFALQFSMLGHICALVVSSKLRMIGFSHFWGLHWYYLFAGNLWRASEMNLWKEIPEGKVV